MRWKRPFRSDPWPHDMRITVEDRPQALLELLWLREAYGLEPHADDLPPLLHVPPMPAEQGVAESVRSRWAQAWPVIWQDVAEHAGTPDDPAIFDRLVETENGSPERASLLRRLVGPSWADEFGRDAFEDASYRSWNQLGSGGFQAANRAVEDDPERRNLDALVPAWRAGLTKIVTIPCQGEHDRRLGASGLLVTDETRADHAAYRRALTGFV
ncbi:hypothetical protein [Agromyces seonyuensis]|uniref:Uncharacterized protein n=1 Tax=Agromyces seonyuensis TaxID=2662446 RepID=A0A6I4P1R2_9MICO|nr:hypothetical protein [Agromyces seonyuensis]MWC00332.1 hypothetical protein [Agromyces seonyuensis]